MQSRKLRSVFLPLFLLLLLSVATILLINSLIQRPSVQHYLLDQLSRSAGYEIESGPIELSLHKGVGISASNIRVNLPGGYNRIIAERIFFNLDLGELLKGRVIPDGLTLVRTEIRFDVEGSRDIKPHGIRGFFEALPLGQLAPIPSLTLEGASISLKGMPVRMEGVFLRLIRDISKPLALDIALKGVIRYRGKPVTVSGTGKIDEDERGAASVQWNLRAGGIPLASIGWPDFLPVKRGTAEMDIRGNASLDGTFWVKGEIKVDDLEFKIIDKGDMKAFAFDELKLPFHLFFSESKLFVPFFQVKSPDFTINVESALDLKNRSNPFLEVSVKTPDMSYGTFRRLFPSSLLPSWVESRLFSIFSEGDVRVDLFSLKGRISQLKELQRSENAAALQLRLTCNALTAFKDDRGVPVKGVSGRLEIKKGRVRVRGVKARFGNSTIHDGTLDLDSLYRDTPSIRVTVDGTFRIQDLLMQRNLAPVPTVVRKRLGNLVPATGEMRAKVEIGYEPGWSFPRVLEGRINFKGCVLERKDLLFPIVVNEGYLTFEKGLRRFFVAEGNWGRSHILGSGVIDPSWNSGNANIVLNADMGELLGHFFPNLYPSLRFKSRLSSLISLSCHGAEWAFSGSIGLKNTSLETESMIVDPFKKGGVATFTGKLRPGKNFYLTNLKCSLGESSFELAGTCDLREKDRFQFRTRTGKLLIEEMGVRFKGSNLRGKGALRFDVTVNASLLRPDATEVTGWAKGQDLFFFASSFHHPIEDCNFEVRFEGKDLFVDSLNLQMGKSPFQCAGKLRGWDGMRGSLAIRSDYLDLSDLIPVEVFKTLKGEGPDRSGISHPEAGSGGKGWRKGAGDFVKKSDVHLDITASRGQWEGFKYGPLRIECALRSGDFYINRSNAKVQHGEVRLRGHVNRGASPGMLFSAYVDLVKQPLRELPHSLNFVKCQAEGMLTMEALLFAEGRTRKDLKSSLTGTVNILLEEGMFKKSNPFIKVMDFVSLRGIFVKRPPGLSEGGLYFESIGGTIDLEKGVAKTGGIAMQSPVFNAMVMGQADLTTGTLDAELAVKPLGTVDSIISSIPIVGHLLTGDQEALYVDYFKVEGPISDPDVSYIALKSLGNSTMGFVKRLFMSPKQLFKSISDAADDFEGRGIPLPDEEFRPENDMGG